MELLARFNPKINKSLKKGYLTRGVHLAPHKLGGINVCANASPGCIASCLNKSGHGHYNRVQVSRIKKAQLFHTKKQEFLSQLLIEINKTVNYCKRKGLKPSFRLNLTSDINWENYKINGKTLMEHFPSVKFYDYCKDFHRMMKFLMGELPKNYHLTFSRSETNQAKCDIILGCGGNVAVVFRKEIPTTYMGYKVVDGTTHDLRFLDPKKCIVGLKALGNAKKDKTGFVVDI